MTGVPILNANIQGYIGVVTGISTCPGIGTDLALKIDFDIADLVNNSANVSGFTTDMPFRLYGTGINTLGAAVLVSLIMTAELFQSALSMAITFIKHLLLHLRMVVEMESLLRTSHLILM